jgi:hypothetical protein
MLGFSGVDVFLGLYYLGLEGGILAEEDTMSPVFGLFNSER